MPVRDDLGTRMKEFYETVPKTRLVRRMPVAIRIDGKAFHTFTRGFEKPFDTVLIETMQDTMKYLCENIQGCVLGYTQSDEITLILVDYQTLDTSAWFDYEVQKMCSIAASMATMAFNKYFNQKANDWYYTCPIDTSKDVLWTKYMQSIEKGAMFDARVFNIPKEEVTNLVYWRQLDAARNSVQMVGQANFSHKELQGKTCNMIQDMLHEQKGINWNDFPTHMKRGSCCVRREDWEGCSDFHDASYPRKKWVVDTEIPMFRGEDRKYIDDLITFED